MAAHPMLQRVIVPTAVVTGLSTASAIAINLATGNDPGPFVWPAVVLPTVASFVASLWLHVRAQQAPAQPAGAPRVRIGDTQGDVSVWAGVINVGSPAWLVLALVAAVALPPLLNELGREARPVVTDQPAPAPVRPAVPLTDADVRMHEVWASSAQNVTHFLEDRGDWAMTDFVVEALPAFDGDGGGTERRQGPAQRQGRA